MRYNFTVLWN